MVQRRAPARRDWLAELRVVREEGVDDRLCDFLAEIAEAAPELVDQVCGILGDPELESLFRGLCEVEVKRRRAAQEVALGGFATKLNEEIAKAKSRSPEEAKPFFVPEPLPKVEAPEAPPLEVVAPEGAARWDELPIPEGASKLVALTYVPGLVGEITEWIAKGAPRPNRMMALAVAAAVVGTLIGRRIEGPSESATHLYIIMLAPTGWGKDWPLHCSEKLIDALGLRELLGPGEFASSPGCLKFLKRQPRSLWLIDEMGDELSLINNQTGNEFVSKIIGTLKKCYNAWAVVRTAEKVSEQSVTIYWPAVSIVGAATPECFFEACTAKDLESGFANRLLILPYEGIRRPPLQDTPRRADVPPKELVERLRKLPKQTGIGQSILDKPLDGPEGGLPKRERVDWGAGASEVYFALSAKMDALEDCGDRSRFELGMRTCEHAVRLATIVAVGRGASRVEREDIEWATQFAEVGWEAACGGYAKYVQDHFGFAKFCEKVLEKSVQFGGWRSERDLARDFRPNNKYGFELTNALKQLQREERIEGVTEETPGRSSPGFQLLKDEG